MWVESETSSLKWLQLHVYSYALKLWNSPAWLEEVLMELYVGDSENARWWFVRKSGTKAVCQMIWKKKGMITKNVSPTHKWMGDELRDLYLIQVKNLHAIFFCNVQLLKHQL